MSFSIDNLSQLLVYTNYLGIADGLLSDQLAGLTTYSLENVNLATTRSLFSSGIGATYSSVSKTITALTSGTVAVDTVNLQAGMRLLVKDQTDGKENGIYTVTVAGGTGVTCILTRASDFNESSELKKYTKVKSTNPSGTGSSNENKIFFLDITPTTGTLDSTVLTWSEFPADSTVQSLLKEVRIGFDDTDNRSDAEYTNIQSLITTSRSAETNLAATLNNIVPPVCTSLNNFYTSQYGARFRTYFKDVYVADPAAEIWTEAFRSLWRRALTEELVVRLGTVTKTTGTWGAFAADKTIQLNSFLELRTTAAIGLTAIPVAVNMVRADGVTSLVTITIPAGTGATAFDLTNTTYSTYSGIDTVTISNSYGTNGDEFEFWVKP